MKNKRAWGISLLCGVVGLFFASTFYVGGILILSINSNLFPLLGGVLAGCSIAIGYRIGNRGKIVFQDASALLTIITLFGFLGVFLSYFFPYVIFELAIPNIASFKLYLSYIQFNFIGIATLFMGALISHEIGAKIVIDKYKLRYWHNYRFIERKEK